MKNSENLRQEILKSIREVDEEYHRLLRDSQDYTIDIKETPFLKKHRIYLIFIWDVTIEMAFYVSQNVDTGEFSLLTENLQNINLLAEKEDLSIGKGNAVDYVRMVIDLTRPNYKHVFIISTFDDIPYKGYLPGEVETERQRVRLYSADKLHPPKVSVVNTNTIVELFVLESNTLQRREYTVSRNGRISLASKTVLDDVGFGY